MQPPPPRADQPLHGIALLVGSVTCFAFADGFTKYLAGIHHPLQISFTRYTIQTLILLPLLLGRVRSHRLIGPHLGAQLVRGLLMLTSTLTFTFAVASLALADATATWFVAPLLVTLLSAIFLGERIRLRRMAALVIGFAGMLIIVRPGTGTFHVASLLVLAAAVSWAVAFVLTRRIGSTADSGTILLLTTIVGFVALLPISPFVWTTPDLLGIGAFLAMSLGNLMGQYLLIRSSNFASPSVLAPFSYAQLVWATVVGAIFFGTLPDRFTVLGSTILVGSGLYIWHRERQLARETGAVPTAP